MMLSGVTTIALTLALTLAGTVPATAATPVTAWTELQTAFADDGNVVVLNADITAPAGESLAVDAGEAITLDLNGRTLIISSPLSDLAAIGVPSTSTLTIAATGGGTLNVTGGEKGAGIGGNASGDGGTITINGGTITANGGEDGAGIGGGWVGKGGTTTINGGTITANAGTNSAGIGGGTYGVGGSTTITGGTITTTWGNKGTGIGGGELSEPGTLDIQGTGEAAAAIDGGGAQPAPITNSTTPAGIGYSAAIATIGTGGQLIIGFHYLVNFDAAGGTSTADTTTNGGDPLSKPSDPTRDGYAFTQWTYSGSAYDFATPVITPLTLTATWSVAAAADDTLPATGFALTPYLSGAALLLLAGLSLIALRRRTSALPR
jgi:hypothetical protein